MLSTYCRTCHRSYRVSPTTWSANAARTFLRSRVSNQRTDRSTSVQTLPFLRILVAAYTHSRAMSNAILVNRLVRAVIPYLTKSVLPQLETKNVKATDVGGSSKRKGKKRAQMYEGDEVFKTNPGVLFDSPHEEQVVMLSIEGNGIFQVPSCLVLFVRS